MKEKTFVSAVVYIYNSEKTIIDFLTGLHTALSQKFELFEIILVNDCSTDNSQAIILETAKQLAGTITLLNLAWRHKKELAMLAGTDLAVGDFVYEIESSQPDFSWDLIAELYEKSVSGYDVVSASPKGGTRFQSRLFYITLNKLSYLKLGLHTETARIISRKALNRTLVDRGKLRYRKILYTHCGFPTSMLQYVPIGKKRKNEDMTTLQRISLASDVFIMFSNVGTHIAVFFSVLFLLFSIAIGIYALIAYLFGGEIISGWTTTMLFLSLGFSGGFLVMSVMAKYISTILMEQKSGNIYTVQSVQKVQ